MSGTWTPDSDFLPPGEMAEAIGQDNFDGLCELGRKRPDVRWEIKALATGWAMWRRGLGSTDQFASLLSALAPALKEAGIRLEVKA